MLAGMHLSARQPWLHRLFSVAASSARKAKKPCSGGLPKPSDKQASPSCRLSWAIVGYSSRDPASLVLTPSRMSLCIKPVISLRSLASSSTIPRSADISAPSRNHGPRVGTVQQFSLISPVVVSSSLSIHHPGNRCSVEGAWLDLGQHRASKFLRWHLIHFPIWDVAGKP